MGEVELQRRAVQAQNMRRFEAWQQYERENSERIPYRSAMELIDYESIEHRARQRIEGHEAGPKPEIKQEYEDNARTALFEALTASGHLSRVELHGTLNEVNAQVLNRLLNGYDYDLPDHELKRRFKEICEELVVQDIHQQIVHGLLPPDTEVGTESAYVVGMSDEAARKIGYRSYNKKGMTRSTGLIMHGDGTVTRTIDQVSYSNSSAHDSILRLHSEGVPVSKQDEADVDLLGHQLIYSRRDISEGVIGLQRRIDAFAGPDVRFGEIPGETTPTYESVRAQSLLREALVGQFIHQLADHEKKLDRQLSRGDITRTQWSSLYAKEVRNIVRTICALQPEYAKDALGEAVVKDYQKAHDLLVGGDASGAAAVMDSASGSEQAITFCGGGFESAQNAAQQSSSSTEQRLEAAKGMQWCHCPFCKADVYMDPCAVNIDCWNCEASVRGGRLVSKGNGGRKDVAPVAIESKGQTQKRQLPGKIAGFILKDQLVVGGTKKIAIHESTGQELTEDQTKALVQEAYS